MLMKYLIIHRPTSSLPPKCNLNVSLRTGNRCYESRLARNSSLAVVEGTVISNRETTIVIARDLIEVISFNDDLNFCDHIALVLDEYNEYGALME